MKEQTSAFIAVIGRPNVGKSTLMNRMLGQKIAIVSDKPQTTRTRIMGILTKGEAQFVFMDTPGFHKPRNALGQIMMKTVGTGLSEVDAALLVVDAAPKFAVEGERLPKAELELVSELARRKLPAVLAINKIDLLPQKDALLSMIAAYQKAYDFDAVVPISAKDGDGLDRLLKEVGRYLKPSPHYFDDTDVTDQPDKQIVCELIREKLLRLLDQEIPHGIAVDLEQFYERDLENGEPILEVHATIYCEKESHKGIIIGKNGAMLKKIGALARADLEAFFGIKTNLQLWVKVKEDWRNWQGLIHTFGLD